MPKYLTNIDLQNNQLLNAKIGLTGTDPSTSASTEGLIWWNSSTHLLKVSDQAGTVQVVGWLGSSTASLAANGTGAAGTATTAARSDHTHTLPANTAASTLTVGGAATIGSSTGVARADHVHAMPAVATTSVAGFMSAADKTMLTNAQAAQTANAYLVLRDADGRFQATDPSAPQDVATKNYVDTTAQGLNAKSSVRAATTAALVITARTSSTLTIGGTSFALDGITLANNDRVLVKDSTTGSGAGAWDNGIYTVGGIGTSVVLTRALDQDLSSEFPAAYVWIDEGAVNNDQGWLCTNTTTAGVTVGTTAITWVQFSGAGQITVTAPILKSGNSLALGYDNATIGVSGNNIYVKNNSISSTQMATSFTAANIYSILGGTSTYATGTAGKLVFDTSPTLVTPTLGVASATTINKVTITAPATGSTLTIANGKTLTASNTLTFTGTDSSSVAFGTGGTVAYTANNLSVFAATTSAQLLGVISDETGSGSLVFASSPTLTTPIIGTVYGSTAASGTLTLSSTTHATKGTVTVGNSNAGTLTMQAATINIKVGAAATGGYLKVDATTGLLSIDTTTHGGVNKYVTSIGDGTTTQIVVTHNLGTADFVAEVYNNSSPYDRVYPDIWHADTGGINATTKATFVFAVAPTSNQYRVVITG